MHENIRLKPQRFDLSMSPRQAGTFLAVALALLGIAFALGLGVGRKTAPQATQPAAAATASKDSLATLDEPLPARGEAPPELKAHQALTDSRSIEKTMPVPAASPAKAPAAPAPHDEEKSAPDLDAPPPAVAASPSPATSGGGSPASSPVTAPASSSAALAPPRSLPPAPRPAREARLVAHRAVARPAPTQAEPASSKGAYTVQVASSSNRADAERLAKQLAARKPRIVMADVPGVGRRYRVQIGSFESREAAKRQAASLSQAGVHGIVTPAH